MNTLTLNNKEMASQFEILKELKEKSNSIGALNSLIEKFETCFANNKAQLIKNIKESCQVTINGLTHTVIDCDDEQCYEGAEDACLYTINNCGKARNLFTFDDLCNFLVEDKLEFHKLAKLVS